MTTLNETTSEEVELRICGNEQPSDEDTPLEDWALCSVKNNVAETPWCDLIYFLNKCFLFLCAL